MRIKSNYPFLAAALFAATMMAQGASSIVDTISFGNAPSEVSHEFKDDGSKIIEGGLGEPARELNPPSADARFNWSGGNVSFNLKVDPARQNFVTARFWGSDTSASRLILFCEGRQIGYRHLGDIDILDFGDDSGEPGYNDRFFYNTMPLPLAMTRGKSELHFEIRSTGPVWGYGNTFDRYQKPMTQPSRGIYKIYTTTDGCFIPPADEKQGVAPVNPPVRQTPGPEVLVKLKERVNHEIQNELKSTRPLNEMQMQFLARAYFVTWTDAHQNPKVVAQVLKGMDALFADFRSNPELVHNDRSTPNPGWFEFGPAGDAISLLIDQLRPKLDEEIQDGDRKISRRAAYGELLKAGRDWHRHHRRLYSNQTMITDMNIYLSNRGLETLGSANAFSEPAARRYLYEAIALEPWRDSDKDGQANQRNWGVGTNYWELTAKGLTRELGYVGYYGEVLDWVTSIYNATRPAPGQPGDLKIKAQLEKIMHARAAFRYPMLDAEGNRAMRIGRGVSCSRYACLLHGRR